MWGTGTKATDAGHGRATDVCRTTARVDTYAAATSPRLSHHAARPGAFDHAHIHFVRACI